MTLQYATFIAGFPEFSDTGRFPVSQFDFWAAQADTNVNQRRAGANLTLAQCLFVAHNLCLAAKAAAAAAVGQIPGQVTGAQSSKSIDKVSVGYTPTTTIEGAGPYNATLYGQQFYQLMKGLNTAMYVPGPGAARAAGRYPAYGYPYSGWGQG